MRWWARAAAGVAVLALWWAVSPSAPQEDPVGPRRTTGEVVLPRAVPRPVAPPEAAPWTPTPQRSSQAYDRVVDACGFEIDERCVETGCGAVVAMPDLDRFDGWLRLMWEQPAVVGSTAARDLGLPLAWTPCGDALLASPEVQSVQLGPHDELWCVGDRGACDLAAAERYGWPGWDGFTGGMRVTRRVFVLD